MGSGGGASRNNFTKIAIFWLQKAKKYSLILLSRSVYNAQEISKKGRKVPAKFCDVGLEINELSNVFRINLNSPHKVLNGNFMFNPIYLIGSFT